MGLWAAYYNHRAEQLRVSGNPMYGVYLASSYVTLEMQKGLLDNTLTEDAVLDRCPGEYGDDPPTADQPKV